MGASDCPQSTTTTVRSRNACGGPSSLSTVYALPFRRPVVRLLSLKDLRPTSLCGTRETSPNHLYLRAECALPAPPVVHAPEASRDRGVFWRMQGQFADSTSTSFRSISNGHSLRNQALRNQRRAAQSSARGGRKGLCCACALQGLALAFGRAGVKLDAQSCLEARVCIDGR